MQKRLTAFSWLGAVLLLWGCATTPKRAGSVKGAIYTSAGGDYSVAFPVSTEVGGRILQDDAHSVTFGDRWGSRISFYSLPFNSESSMTTVLQEHGREKALEALARRLYGDLIVPHYHPEILGGALSFIVLKPVGPKTGVAMYIARERVYLVETDLLPGVQLLERTDEASQRDRDQWLENRALSLLGTMEIK